MTIYDKDKKLSDTLWLDPNLRDEGAWQVIYMTVDKLTYARETYNGEKNLAQICEIADREIEARNYLAKAKIEKW